MATVFRFNNDKNEKKYDWTQLTHESNTPQLANDFSENDTIWRYYDLSKFIHFLLSKKLYLTRIDKFQDKYEGELPLEDYLKNMHELLERLSFVNDLKREDMWSFLEIQNKLPIFASCWHLNPIENFAMWKIYLSTNEGVAIKTKIGDLISSIKNPTGLIYGKVNYLDFEKESISQYCNRMKEMGIRKLPLPCFFKRSYYSYENEFRVGEIITANYQSGETYRKDIECLLKTAPKSREYNIALETLDYEIYISPFSSDWFYYTIEKLLKALNIKIKIHTSKITNNIEWK